MSKFIANEKETIDSRTLVQIRIIKIDEGIKYSFVLIRDGHRILGYDNHENQSPHKHVFGVIVPYEFISINILRADFWRDVQEIMRRLE